MKHLFSILTLAAALIAFTIPARAQYGVGSMGAAYGPATLSIGTNSTIQLNSTNTPNATIDARFFQNLSLQAVFQMSGTESPAPALTFTFQQSVDGVNWSTVGNKTWGITSSGATNFTTAVTNFVVGGVGWWRLNTIASAATNTVVTNLVVSYAIKRAAP